MKEFLCQYRYSDGKMCNTPITFEKESPSGFVHSEGKDWLHWASPLPYGPQDSKDALLEAAKGQEPR